ncbi:MAG: hypothetical protein ACYC2H_08535 [Thermoplasmatota archaeon]
MANPVRDNTDLLSWLIVRLRTASQGLYTATAGITSTMELAESNPAALREQVVVSLNSVPQRPDGRTVGPQDLDMTDEQTRLAARRLPLAVAELTVLRLDALLHEFLDRLNRRDVEQDSTQFEQDLQSMRDHPNGNIRAAYQLVILLSVLRNAVVHTDGAVSERGHRRLRDANWTTEDLGRFPPYRQLTIGDCLNFKANVRAAANYMLQTRPKA